MVFKTLVAALTGLSPALARTSQFPVVDDVIGGVPTEAQHPALSYSAKTFTSVAETGRTLDTVGTLRYKENTGFCESTPGVYTASGYGDIAANKSVWFWFFEARKNPSSAPLAIWLNGGPGSSSMIGLFQEHGPCRVNNDSTALDLNPYSWNEYANMLYIDQPVTTGFSHGIADVGTSEQAAAQTYDFLQIFFKDPQFKKYASRKFALWTESYGGHYGPVFASYFLDQNKAIKNKTSQAVPINLYVLGIGNGLTDPALQYPQYLTYASSNPYHPLVNSTVLATVNTSITTPETGCLARIEACNTNLTDAVCSATQSYCNSRVLNPLAGIYDVYDVRSEDPDPYPPSFGNLLNTPETLALIGAEVNWTQSSRSVYSHFASTGDWMRSKRPALESVINDGSVRTIMFDGDADYICNYMGFEAVANALQTKWTKQFARTKWSTWKVDGQVAGQFRNAGKFSYVRVYGAGHEVPAYQYGNLKTGQAALEMFKMIMQNDEIYNS